MNEELKDTHVSPEEELEKNQTETQASEEGTEHTDAPLENENEASEGSEGQVDIEIEGEEPQTLEKAMEIIAKLQLSLRNQDRKLTEEQEINMRLQADFVNFRKRKENHHCEH